MSSAVLFQDVSYTIDHKVILDHIYLEIVEGSITGILGPNGAGKTTVLSLINGLRRHTGGTVSVLGSKLPKKSGTLRARIGVVLQETALYEELTTFENLRFSASLYNVVSPIGRIIEVLELLKLSDRADQVVRTLSGGLKRRIAIARSLLHDPELLIIDEPTLGVDVEARHAIWQYLRLLKSKGRTVIVATNYLDEAQALCDTVAVLRGGRLLTFESPDVLVERAGYCLDIECKEGESENVKNALEAQDGIMRIDKTSSGVSVFLKSDFTKEHIMASIMKKAHVGGFRFRPPDLAEVFKTLEETS